QKTWISVGVRPAKDWREHTNFEGQDERYNGNRELECEICEEATAARKPRRQPSTDGGSHGKPAEKRPDHGTRRRCGVTEIQSEETRPADFVNQSRKSRTPVRGEKQPGHSSLKFTRAISRPVCPRSRPVSGRTFSQAGLSCRQ